jgi:hypothetical protein
MNKQMTEVYPKEETKDGIEHEQTEDRNLPKIRDRR